MLDITTHPNGGCFICGSHEALIVLPGTDPRLRFRICLVCSSQYTKELPQVRPQTHRRVAIGANNPLSGPLSAVHAATRASARRRIVLCVPPSIPCPACEGSGGPECQKCDGTGGPRYKEPCGLCEAKGSYPCPYCKGKGKEFLFFKCPHCQASGTLECEVCHGSGDAERFDPCAACEGTGHTCPQCRGAGQWILYREP